MTHKLKKLMSTRSTEESDALQSLGKVVAQLGIPRVVTLLAEIAREQSDYLLLSGDHQKAAQFARKFKILDRALMQLKR